MAGRREIKKHELPPNKACTPATPAISSRGKLRRGRKAGHPATNAGTCGWDSARFLEVGSELWQFPVSGPCSPQPPSPECYANTGRWALELDEQHIVVLLLVRSYQLSTVPLRRYAGWAALASGSVVILGLVFLILFFALEFPQGSASTLRFGHLSDVTPIINAPINVIVIVMILLLQRKDAPSLSILAASLGLAGILLTAWTNIMFVSEKISLEEQVQLFYVSLVFLGSWYILVNSVARHDGALPSRLTIFGIWVGIGQVILGISSFLLGGYDDMFSSSSTAIMMNIPLLISLAIVIPLGLIGYLGAPIWLVWLRQTLLRSNNQLPSLNDLDATN